MKKNFLAIFVAIVAVQSMSAQLAFGLQAGANYSMLHWDNEKVASDDSGFGYTAGCLIEYIDPKISLGLDVSLLVSKENYKLIFHQLSKDTKIDRGDTFVKFPLHVKWKPTFVNNGTVFKPIFYTGPEFAFLLPFHKKEVSEERRFVMSSPVKWNIGIGAEFINHIEVKFQYGIGLNTLIKHENYVLSGNDNARAGHTTFTLSVGWLFR